jgi:hypothetical protein
VANGAGCILPQADLRTDYWYQVNGFLIRNAHPEDTILTDGGFISDSYLELYTSAKIISVHLVRLESLKQIIATPHGGRFWISSWALKPPAEVERTGYFHSAPFASQDAAVNRAYLNGLSNRMVKRDESIAQQVWELLPP